MAKKAVKKPKPTKRVDHFFTITSCTVDKLFEHYIKHLEKTRKPLNGRTHQRRDRVSHTFQSLREAMGETRFMNANRFGPRALQEVRAKVVKGGWKYSDGRVARPWSKDWVNHMMARVVRLFRWGVSMQKVHPDVWWALKSVRPLTNHEMGVITFDPIKPVPWEHIEALQPFMPEQLWDMINLHWLTGMRIIDLLEMRLGHLDKSLFEERGVWLYRPPEHKTVDTARGASKVIVLGPKSIAIVKRYLPTKAWVNPARIPRHMINRRQETTPYWDILFTPSRAYEQWKVICKALDLNRMKNANDKFKWYYTRHTYRGAIIRAIAIAGKRGVEVPPWSPSQIRHSRSTEIDHKHGPLAFSALTGDHVDMRKVYVERNLTLAIEIARTDG